MPELPSGTVTFLFTDLESSTRLWEEQPEAMTGALARHDEILRNAVEDHEGIVLTWMGDGVAAVFTPRVSAKDILATAELTIGRAEQSDIPLADPGVSRNHARVVREGDDFIVEDLRSTNGTEVNGQPIRRRRLANGDLLKLASSTLQFRREG